MRLKSLGLHCRICEKIPERPAFPRIDAKFSDDVLLSYELFYGTSLFLIKLTKTIYYVELREMTNDV